MTEALLTVSGLGKRFGGFVALDGIDLRLAPGERLGLIGPNGSGKSTFVNCLCGALRNESGSVTFDRHGLDGLKPHQRTRLGLARSFQLPRPFRSLTLSQNIRVPLLYAAAHRAGVQSGDVAVTTRCHELLHMVGLEAKAHLLTADLTQVEMRKLELARAMAAAPKLLIADEALAGLSHSEVDDILALLLTLNAQGVAVIFIEHIMRAVMAFSQRLIVFVAGRKIADGDPRVVIENPDVVSAYLGQ